MFWSSNNDNSDKVPGRCVTVVCPLQNILASLRDYDVLSAILPAVGWRGRCMSQGENPGRSAHTAALPIAGVAQIASKDECAHCGRDGLALLVHYY